MADEQKDGQSNPTSDPEHFRESASDRAHGTHGKGDSRETLHEGPNAAAADGSRDSSIVGGGVSGGSAGWGSEGAGGSTVDRRSEPRGKDKKKKR